MAKFAARKGLATGFYAVIPDRLISSPAFSTLSNMRDIGLYFLILGRSDIYGCLPAYPTAEMTRGSVLGNLINTMSIMEFRKSILSLLAVRLIIPLQWGAGHVFLLPHKLPSVSMSYYPTPRIIPANVVIPHILEAAKTDFYLNELTCSFNFDRVLEHSGVVENVAMANIQVPEWLANNVKEEPWKKEKKPKKKLVLPKVEPLEEMCVEVVPQAPPPRTNTDMRVVEISNYIKDNKFDIHLSEDDIQTMTLKYGREYAKRMIDLYGDWRLNNPKKAASHKSHYRAINAEWVHEKCQKTVLPNPNEELIALRWNVMVSPVEKAELMKEIASKLGETNPENQMEWLKSFADRVSGMKAKNSLTSTDMDANYILEKIETQAKWR